MTFIKKNINWGLLHIACANGNLDLVKYVISLKLPDYSNKDVIYYFCFINHLLKLQKIEDMKILLNFYLVTNKNDNIFFFFEK